MQLIPARGRLRKVAVVADKILRCSLSPRGDGYCLTAGIVHRQKDAAYLREGTVTHSALRMRCPCRCSLAPRGDGYTFSFANGMIQIGMQLSPARGRLQGLKREVFEGHDAAYPREGTVTHVSWCKSARAKGCSLSPRGDGYDRYFAAVSAMPDAAYPREGTVTDMLVTLAMDCFRCSLSPRGDSVHMFSPANFRHFIDNSHILCYTSW